MKHNLFSLALAAGMLLVGAGVQAEAASQAGKKLHTIGDSTMDSYVGGNTNKLGWGAPLQQFMNGLDANQQGITVNNRGKSGSSTRTFYTDARFWATMTTGGSDAMQAGDILLIQFAHNDENNKGVDALELKAYNEAHGLAAITDLRGTTPTTTYKENLRLYINEAKAMGVKPILVSAMCRNYFNGTIIKPSGRHNLKDGFSVLTENGLLENQKLTTDDHSMDYTYQMQQVALEYEDVPFIDMTAATAEMFETLGSAYCNANIFNVGDGTHTGPLGATLIARCFATTLLATADAETNTARKAVLDELAQYVSLSSDITLSPESMDFGSNYVGTPVEKTFNLAGFDITPATGTYTIAASEGYEVSLDGENYASTLTPTYDGGSIFATIRVRGTASAEGAMPGTLTVTCGTISKTATLSMVGLVNTSGTESAVVWTMEDGNATATTSGILSAGEEFLSGLVLGSPIYQEIDGIKYRRYKTAEAWPDQEDEVTDRYIQFSAGVPAGMDFRLDRIELDVVAVATNYLRCRIYYATKADFTDAVQVKEFTSMASNTPNHVSVMPMKNLTAGDSIYVRIYPWMQGASATGKYIGLKDVTIHGYTEEIPEYEPTTIEWLLKDNTTDFATQINLNGDGTQAPSYSYNGLIFVGEKQAKDPAVEYINSNYGFHTNGASNANQRYIQFTPEYSGTLTVTFKSNNSSNERTAYIGSNFTTTDAVASASSMATATTFSGELVGGTTYYVYASSGVSFHKLQYDYNKPIVSAIEDTEATTESVKKIFVNGQIVIVKDNCAYTLMGQPFAF